MLHLDDTSNIATVKKQLPVTSSAGQQINQDVGTTAGNALGIVVVSSTPGSSSSVECVVTPAVGACVESVASRVEALSNQPDVVSKSEETKIVACSPVIAMPIITGSTELKCMDSHLTVSPDTIVVKVASPPAP